MDIKTLYIGDSSKVIEDSVIYPAVAMKHLDDHVSIFFDWYININYK